MGKAKRLVSPYRDEKITEYKKLTVVTGKTCLLLPVTVICVSVCQYKPQIYGGLGNVFPSITVTFALKNFHSQELLLPAAKVLYVELSLTGVKMSWNVRSRE